MEILADTSVFMAVAMDEPEKPWVVEVTAGAELVAPAVLPYEIGNAISSLVKSRKLRADQAMAVLDATRAVPVSLLEVDDRKSLSLAVAKGICAYDAYFLQCAAERRCPLLTLDLRMRRVARELSVKLVEQT